MEAMRTARLRPVRDKGQLQVIDNAVYDSVLREEGDDLHRPSTLGAALRSPL
jgi:hypothetical protein